ncbi:hypothetical protein Ptr902_02755 [Pyrenophora tritici-repentis]|nr:hypothetical protein Ptr902_11455 [Pyrenophora tritici-repentis]KAI2483815.1 hypothetical protein Ptr902_02755 [Pyrenophora tritici-repentis]
MPPTRPPKRPRRDAFAPNKRAKRLSPRKALATVASQATEPPTFESQLRESQPKAAIVALTEGSSAATVAIIKDDEDGNEDRDKGLDDRFADNFNGID